MDMMTPPPVDLSRLKGILGNAKNLMKKVESGDFETGNIDSRALTEDGVRELQAEGVVRAPMQQMGQPQIGYSEERVMNSGLPESIKKIMLEKPIPQLTNANYTFSLDDVSELAEEKPMGYPKVPKKMIRESHGDSDLITVSKSQINEMVSAMVNERLLEFFSKSYNKTLTEETVKKTLNVLIKEGRLLPKKKTL